MKDKIFYRKNSNGSIFWFKNDKLHKDDGPAIIGAFGDKFWYKNGMLHRLDGPASEFATGDKYWFIDSIEYTEEEYKEQILIRQLAGLK